MFDKILGMLEHSNPSYKDRLKSMDEFFRKYDLYKEMWPEQPREPLSIVWALSGHYPEIFLQQLGAFAQMTGILHPEDEIVFVADRHRRDDAINSKYLTQQWNTKSIIISRPFPGDGPAINWDIGVEHTSHDRLLFIRDMVLFFNPWELVRAARLVDIEMRLVNFSTVLGPVWSRYSDRWLYLIHPRFAPNPFLFAFVLNKHDYEHMNGFDPQLSRGFDHMGELDFLLRWNMAGNGYDMTEGTSLFHPGISASSQQELEEMQYQSAINRRYFFDRYGDSFINDLKPPYQSNMNLIEVNHALTFAPLSEVREEDMYGDGVQLEPVKDAFEFNKWPADLVISEII